MKKAAAAVLVLGLGLATMAMPAFSQTDPHAVPVTMNVSGLFGLTLDKAALDFGTAQVGTELAPQVIAFEARSNHGVAWTVTLQAAPLTNDDGVTTVDGANFQYFHTFDNPDANEIPAPGQTLPVPTTASTVFEAGPNIYNVNFAGFGLGFKVILPGNQKAGNYSTTLNIAMVDSI